ncbi:tyrosine-protein kinase SRK2-like [Mizuhopecten yessoensis]|uniref:Tyrosine-protein kinase n=1 Tax=Mizuhopecten yessoensis TaxID=6573 RepID=A0A210PW17_MIZYE|nr:tyrosine-protein kinase SRK2-like [Mizuhopecten yessoensis]OWF40652.1 Tyrosine-protein kinase Src-2 [Mizuhopecten yessoensis]
MDKTKPGGAGKVKVKTTTSKVGKPQKQIVFPEEDYNVPSNRQSPVGYIAEIQTDTNTHKKKVIVAKISPPSKVQATKKPKKVTKPAETPREDVYTEGNLLVFEDAPNTNDKRPAPLETSGDKPVTDRSTKVVTTTKRKKPGEGPPTQKAPAPKGPDISTGSPEIKLPKLNKSKPPKKSRPIAASMPNSVSSVKTAVTNRTDAVPMKSQRTEKYNGPVRDSHLLVLHDYEARMKGDMAIRRGEVLLLVDANEADWWVAKQKHGTRQGYIPSAYVAREGTMNIYPWYGGEISLRESERLLMRPRLVTGTFLIRKPEKGVKGYMLSMRYNQDNNNESVKHYRVKETIENGSVVFYLTLQRSFESLPQLVLHYMDDKGILCHTLTAPCPIPQPILYDMSRETQKDWELDRKTIDFIVEVGQGHFGTVWKGTWNKNTFIAVKTLRPGSMSPQSFMTEAHIMRQLTHTNLVRLYAVCSQDEPIYIITEYVTKGSLAKFLKSREGRKLKLPNLIDIAAQVASGMAYLETKRFIHRDLAARNILIGDGNIAKVADFGLAKIIEGYDYQNPNTNMLGNIFPIKWTAPEAAFFGRFTMKSDVWSYGILLMEIITYGQIPYAGIRSDQILKKIQKGYRMPIPRNCPQPVYNIMMRTWDAKAGKRPTFDYLYHFFDTYYYNLKKDNFPI